MCRHYLSPFERAAVLEGSDGLDCRPGECLCAGRQRTAAGIAFLPFRHVAVAAAWATYHAGAEQPKRRQRCFLAAQYGSVSEADIRAHPFHRHVVDPKIAGRHQAEGGAGLFPGGEVGDVGEGGPAEGPVFLQLNILFVEHELGGCVPLTRAEVEPADVGRYPVTARLQVLRLGNPNLSGRRAEQQRRSLARAWNLTYFKRAVAFIFPPVPLCKDPSELVAVFGDLEGRIDNEIIGAHTAGRCKNREDKAAEDVREAGRDSESHRRLQDYRTNPPAPRL
jgi:hypothetical protein